MTKLFKGVLLFVVCLGSGLFPSCSREMFVKDGTGVYTHSKIRGWEDSSVLSMVSLSEIEEIREAKAPFLVENILVFTYADNQVTGDFPIYIAFSDDDFQQYHAMKKNIYGVYIFIYSQFDSGVDLVFNQTPYTYFKDIEYVYINRGIISIDPQNDNKQLHPNGKFVSFYRAVLEGGSYFRAKNPQRLQGSLYRFTFYSSKKMRINLVGSFNRWNTFSHPLQEDPRSPFFYTIDVLLPEGPLYYLFLIDGQYLIADPNNTISTTLTHIQFLQDRVVSYYQIPKDTSS